MSLARSLFVVRCPLSVVKPLIVQEARATVPSPIGRGRRAKRAGEGGLTGIAREPRRILRSLATLGTKRRHAPGQPPTTRSSESGFTLAGLIVILTIISVVLAFTVPRMWSDVLRRERDKQTIFVMRQYARAIAAYQAKHGIPTSLDQIKEARSPRFMRGPTGEWADPLTGEVDWILVPAGQPQQGGAPAPGTTTPGTTSSGPGTSTGGTDTASTDTSSTDTASNDDKIHRLGTSPKNFNGPFIGVRPGVTGRSFVVFNGAERYEQWTYTTNELTAEIAAAVNGVVPGAVAPGAPPTPSPKK
jgi:type II secretory pathway pseudopilin PulG